MQELQEIKKLSAADKHLHTSTCKRLDNTTMGPCFHKNVYTGQQRESNNIWIQFSLFHQLHKWFLAFKCIVHDFPFWDGGMDKTGAL